MVRIEYVKVYCSVPQCVRKVFVGSNFCEIHKSLDLKEDKLKDNDNDNVTHHAVPDLSEPRATSYPIAPAHPFTPAGKRDLASEGEETKDTLGGGATRTKSPHRFDLIPIETSLRTALRFGAGAAKHGENNWRKGDWTFVVSCFNHIETHINTLKQEGNERDDNIGAILWNGHAIGWYEQYKPDEFRKALQYLRDGIKPE